MVATCDSADEVDCDYDTYPEVTGDCLPVPTEHLTVEGCCVSLGFRQLEAHKKEVLWRISV